MTHDACHLNAENDLFRSSGIIVSTLCKTMQNKIISKQSNFNLSHLANPPRKTTKVSLYNVL